MRKPNEYRDIQVIEHKVARDLHQNGIPTQKARLLAEAEGGKVARALLHPNEHIGHPLHHPHMPQYHESSRHPVMHPKHHCRNCGVLH